MSRSKYDLSHFIFNAFQIGRLQTMSVIPVLAGDSITIDYNGIFRLAALRRPLTMDAVVDMFAFYIPHRHHYGDTWLDYVKDGMNNTVNLPSSQHIEHDYHCLGRRNVKGTFPKWRVDGYNMIYNRYFKNPADTRDFNLFSDSSQYTREYGLTCCHLKRMWNTGNISPDLDSHKDVPLDGDPAATVDLWNIEKFKAMYNNLAQRNWFTVRYNDILKRTWGAAVNIDADQRPDLLGRTTRYLSGYDVDGTTETTLGKINGKAFGEINFQLPRRFIPEHGAVWFMCLIRFPAVHEQEIHYLDQKINPFYEELTADPRVIPHLKPTKYEGEDFFYQGGNSDYGQHPFGWWYREQPNVVHSRYDDNDGYAFLTKIPDQTNDVAYVHPDDYKEVFNYPDQLGHATCQSTCGLTVHRVIPDALSGIFV